MPSPRIVIVDHGLGNPGSIRSMLKHIGYDSRLSRDASDLRDADRLILPGVGAFDQGMRNMQAFGLVELLGEIVLSRGTPLLGICLGMQLLSAGSEEGVLPGLGWIDARTVRFRDDGSVPPLKIPHMGWNDLDPRPGCPLFDGLPAGHRFYFVHSYHLTCRDPGDVAATTRYGAVFPSAVQRNHIFGVQFHPEKSHRFGMLLLANFIARI